jgi:hypothetical protein
VEALEIAIKYLRFCYHLVGYKFARTPFLVRPVHPAIVELGVAV